ncbi:uncharacterized protein PFL1_00412 [Pseudozyma flocculosa PF-1]|uniref:Related to Alcohol dehydrogenase class III chi chain n=1 Tax=Pseudozyma flocculosa TaxID=84751 RepID=A0A5C3EUU8_9BASI|nr:uncharacterized protein PFL1_00412 [Pseudozyma flocculosa PF-1]EPQ32215.1 hypothetical protein PFL1_00412 [Pseudozyma flocculosa PF-1]SPO34841.1 related to Alcohol dehydrogenase class III chi chain [Pseudozyma flocculosa]
MADKITTRALVALAPGEPLSLQTVELDTSDLGSDEAVVEFTHSGLCHTDLAVASGHIPGRFPAVLGHEGAGIVRRLPRGYAGPLAVGDRVLATFAACGQCTTCRHSYTSACTRGVEYNFGFERGEGRAPHGVRLIERGEGSERAAIGFFGQSSFAQTSICRQTSLVKVADDLPFDLVCSFGCGFQTGFGTVRNHLIPCHAAAWSQATGSGTPFRPRSLAVFGIGAVGLGAVIAAKAEGIERIIAVEPTASRRQLALEAGAIHAFDPLEATSDGPGEPDPAAKLKGMTDGEGVDLIVDATGNSTVFRHAVHSLASKGHLCVVGAPPAGTELSFDAFYVLNKGLLISSIVEGASIPERLLPQMLDLVKQGAFDVLKKAVKVYRPDQVDEAVRAAKSGEVLKPVFAW